MTPRLLDLFCCAGGASMGYHMAGFDVVGVDAEQQPRYPFEFRQMDITTLTKRQARNIQRRFDAVAASPPCQAHTPLRHLHKHKQYTDLVEWTRDVLDRIGLPFIIENVPGAPLLDPVQLCGSAFGLRVRRHRLFEANWDIRGIGCSHEWQNRHRPYGYYRGGRRVSRGERTGWTGIVPVYGNEALECIRDRNGNQSPYPRKEGRRVAMGIDWMSSKELSQAIPPVYTFYLGKQLMEVI